MRDKKEFDRWKSLFQREQNGKSPDEFAYEGIPPLPISPYIARSTNESSGPGHRNTIVSHGFRVDDHSAIWLAEKAPDLVDYNVTGFTGSLLPDSDERLQSAFRSHLKSRPESQLKTRSHFCTLNLREKDILGEIRRWLALYKENPEADFSILPANDFILNVTVIRGIEKYLQQANIDETQLKKAAIYIPLHDHNIPGDESLLIPFSTQILSLMVCGLANFLWDIRHCNDWQRSNLIYFLNIPEILQREGEVLQMEDPVKGSGFFEEMSHQIADNLG